MNICTVRFVGGPFDNNAVEIHIDASHPVVEQIDVCTMEGKRTGMYKRGADRSFYYQPMDERRRVRTAIR